MKTKSKSVCAACGVPWSDHMGICGTCEELQFCKDLLASVVERLRKYHKIIKHYEKTTKSRKH
jgi:hypothetical protein